MSMPSNLIWETIVTTQSADGTIHIAPMGVREWEHGVILAPFKPSTTLENVLANESAALNLTDDVRVFAGCLTGRRGWPTTPCEKVNGVRLHDCLSHRELRLARIEQDELRPRLFCETVLERNHAPFRGFNRAQAAVIETAILVSRLHMLPWEKIESELRFHTIAIDKTAGPRELEAWSWLQERISQFKDEGARTA